MPIKTILLPIRESDMSEHMLESGLEAAKNYNAHVDVFYVHPKAEDVMPFATMGMTASMKDQIRQNAERSSRDQAARLKVLFEQVRDRVGVASAKRGERISEATAAWMETQGVRSMEVARHGRLADLMFIPRPERANPPPKTFEAMLRDTGRPVIMVPRGGATGPITGHVVIGWNGSTEAARAVAASRPVLRGASAVTVLVSRKRHQQNPNADAVVTYLRCHGVNAQPKVVDMTPGRVGEQVTKQCADLGAQLLVVGSYSRTRFQEMLLGGVTRYLISEARLPVLLVH